MSAFRPNWDKVQALDTLERVTQQMAAAVTGCSRDFRYLWANQAYANWIQRPLSEIVNRPIAEILGKDAFEALLPHFDRECSPGRQFVMSKRRILGASGQGGFQRLILPRSMPVVL